MTWTQVLSGLNLVLLVGATLKDRYYKIYAPYGRFSTAGAPSTDGKLEWRKDYPVEARFAWLLFELPNLVCGSAILAYARMVGAGTRLGWLAVCLFMLHYVIRTLIYSQLLRGSKPMPLEVVCYGMLFTLINGTVQTYHHLFEMNQETSGVWLYLKYVRMLWGLCLFFSGFGVNQWSDTVLRRLRKNDADTNYYIPQGFLFDYISAPNLVGEIVEWFGYAIMVNTFVGYTFFITTLFTVGNRAIGHHEWYLNKFEDYPKQRKALIPFVY